MYYPSLQTIPATREAITVFRGLNQRADISEGEFANMENMCDDFYPQAASSYPPLEAEPEARPRGMLVKEVLCYVQGTSLVVGDDEIDIGISPGTKQLVSMGAYILIMPDKMYFNTADFNDYGYIEKMAEGDRWLLNPCDSKGNLRIPKYVCEKAPTDPANGDIWYDNTEDAHELRQYNAEKKAWVPIQGYVRVIVDGKIPDTCNFAKWFSSGDVTQLKIFGDEMVDDTGAPVNLQDENRRMRLAEAVKALAGEVTVRAVDAGSVIIPGLLPAQTYLGNQIRFGNKMPNMKYLFECGNRLWGCAYGMRDGKFVNEIYASKLGDFRIWDSFQGVSTDSYVASLGTTGSFTGAINYLGSPVFFKENFIHRVYGSYPAEFRIQTIPGKGVSDGSPETLCMLGDTALYYGSGGGVYAFDGSIPTLISPGWEVHCGPGVAVVDKEKYYLSLPEGLFVYDSRRRLWHRRSPIGASQICNWRGHLYYYNYPKDGIWVLNDSGNGLAFSMETGILADSQHRSIRSICLRYALRKGWARVMVEYDSSGVWMAAGSLSETGLGWTNLPLKPRRCDHFRLKICGEGEFRLYSIIKTMERGSDLP